MKDFVRTLVIATSQMFLVLLALVVGVYLLACFVAWSWFPIFGIFVGLRVLAVLSLAVALVWMLDATPHGGRKTGNSSKRE